MLISVSEVHQVQISYVCSVKLVLPPSVTEETKALDFRCLFGQRSLSSGAAPPNVNRVSSHASTCTPGRKYTVFVFRRVGGLAQVWCQL